MPLIGHRQRRAAVGDLEADREIVAAHQRALLDQAAEPEALAGRDVLFGDHRRRRKEHDESRNAFSTSAAAIASTASEPPIIVNRRCLRVMRILRILVQRQAASRWRADKPHATRKPLRIFRHQARFHTHDVVRKPIHTFGTMFTFIRMMLSENRSHFSASCLSIEPEDLQAFVQLPQPLGIGPQPGGRPQRAFRLVAIAQHHIGPHQPQPSLDVVAVLLQSAWRAARPCCGSWRCGRPRSCPWPRPSHRRTAPARREPPTRARAACTSGRHGASGGAFASIARQIAAASALRPSCSAARPRK